MWAGLQALTATLNIWRAAFDELSVSISYFYFLFHFFFFFFS